ncbi:MAG: TadE family protein [Bdellovibrionales bacterium]
MRFRSRASCRRAARRGAFAPEFALIAPVFFLLLMGVIELCLMEGAQQMLESAAYNTSRLAKTGFVAENQTQAETINQILVNILSSYGSLLDPAHVVTTQSSYSSFSGAAAGGGTIGYGTASEIVTYTISYPWKIFTPLMCSALGSLCGTDRVVVLTSTIVVRNEPYS